MYGQISGRVVQRIVGINLWISQGIVDKYLLVELYLVFLIRFAKITSGTAHPLIKRMKFNSSPLSVTIIGGEVLCPNL